VSDGDQDGDSRSPMDSAVGHCSFSFAPNNDCATSWATVDIPAYTSLYDPQSGIGLRFIYYILFIRRLYFHGA